MGDFCGRILHLGVGGMIDEKTAEFNDSNYFDSVARIRLGLEQARKGLGRPVDEVFAELENEE
jgi:hypothetical protein